MVVIRVEFTETSRQLLGFPSPAFTDWTSTTFLSEVSVPQPIDVSIELTHNINSQWVQLIVHPKQVGMDAWSMTKPLLFNWHVQSLLIDRL